VPDKTSVQGVNGPVSKQYPPETFIGWILTSHFNGQKDEVFIRFTYSFQPSGYVHLKTITSGQASSADGLYKWEVEKGSGENRPGEWIT
jgi:hypothetical protein